LVVVLNPTVLIPTPLVLSVGIIIGGTLLRPLDSSRILTFESPKVYLRTISSSNFLVIPSNTLSVGATEYPLPTEDIPTDLITARLSIVTSWGNPTLGLSVLSEGKLYPISLIFVLPIFPIVLLETSARAFLPISEVIVEIPGRE